MIAVFKTSVKTKTQVKRLQPHIDKAIPNAKWNFDLADIDKILRIESGDNIALTIISLLHTHQYTCEEL